MAKPKMRRLLMNVPPTLLSHLDAYADRRELSRAEVVRRALEHFLVETTAADERPAV
jgi:metal-responsive CopG/Arc/MetJ family transcriptional regulator